MTLDINFGNGWWRFKLVSADIDLEYPDFCKITFDNPQNMWGFECPGICW